MVKRIEHPTQAEADWRQGIMEKFGFTLIEQHHDDEVGIVSIYERPDDWKPPKRKRTKK